MADQKDEQNPIETTLESQCHSIIHISKVLYLLLFMKCPILAINPHFLWVLYLFSSAPPFSIFFSSKPNGLVPVCRRRSFLPNGFDTEKQKIKQREMADCRYTVHGEINPREMFLRQRERTK